MCFMVDKNDAKSKNNSSDTDEGVVLVMEDTLEPPKVRAKSAMEFPKISFDHRSQCFYNLGILAEAL